MLAMGEFRNMRKSRGESGNGKGPLTPQQQILIDRIGERIRVLGLKPTNVSKDAGCSGSYVADILDGKIRSPGREKLESIAAVLKTDIAYLTGLRDSPVSGGPLEAVPDVGRIPIVGTVEAGAFRKMSDVATLDGAVLGYTVARRSPKYPKARHFAFQVRGDSMNASSPPILDGMTVLCVDLIDTDRPIESGGIYVVRRTVDAGQTYEFTVKRADVYRDRVELVPDSTNPIHEKFVLRHDAPHEDAVEVIAIGRVYHVGSDVP